MESSQKQVLFILLGNLEQQIAAIKSIISVATSPESHPSLHVTTPAVGYDSNFTSETEDEQIAKALQLQQEKSDQYLRDLVADAAKEIQGADGLDS